MFKESDNDTRQAAIGVFVELAHHGTEMELK
jgi:hypothetical protein